MSDEPTLHFEADPHLGDDFIEYVRISTTVRAKQMEAPFTCMTIDGTVASGGPGDWVAIDSRGFPYPIANDSFESNYAYHPDDARAGRSIKETKVLRRLGRGLDSAE